MAQHDWRRVVAVPTSHVTSVVTALSFGRFELRPASRELIADGQPTPLGARAFDVLQALIERRERLVTKNELLDLVWPGVVVEENNLQVQISTLRKVLGPQSIATVPGRGYRFTAALNGASQHRTAAVESTTTTIDDSLPTQREPLYGRDADIGAITELLQRHAHVSIVGPGGIGKTRLAQAVAAGQQTHRPDLCVWWVEFGALGDGALVVGAIAQVLGVEASERPVLETVIALLQHEHALLVIDNCEHLLDAVADCVQALMARAPRLRILVTSQEALRTSGEHVYRLAGLPIEGSSDSPAAACALFVARAEAADPRLRLTEVNRATVAEICRRLDGMPLAIELAAARVRLLGVDGVHKRLDERLHILTGGTRTMLQRHQTLRAALEWSYNLLSRDEQTVFRRLGVFVGGFTLELAQLVAADEQIDRWAVLDLLGHLVDKSLVIADGDELPRYRLLETMRAFALEQLATAGETPALLHRHAEALLAFLLPYHEQRRTTNIADQTRLGGELDNLRAALGWAESTAGDRALACALIGSSGAVWLAHDLSNEGIERALRLLPLPDDLTPTIEARFNLVLGSLGYGGARRECFLASLRAADLYRSLRDKPRLIDALIVAAQIGSRLGQASQVAAAIAEAEALIDPSAPPAQAAALALAKAVNHAYLAQHEQAVESALRQAAFHRDSGNEWGAQLAMSNVAFFGCGLGRFDSAIMQLRTALDVLRRMNVPFGVGKALQFLVLAHALRGDRDEALANGRAAVPYAQRGHSVGWMLLSIALVHARHGAHDRAASLMAYFDDESARGGYVVLPMLARVRDEILSGSRAALGPTEVDRHMATGATLTEEQALALAFD
jgi:predicted ATPase/DNA-binding winged helix-turn-helix (wHTH) protein